MPLTPKFLQGLLPFANYFSDIDLIIGEKATSSRVRFMLQDLVDLRKSQWKPRRDVAGPKTIDQVQILPRVAQIFLGPKWGKYTK
jgi:hypothetical protein